MTETPLPEASRYEGGSVGAESIISQRLSEPVRIDPPASTPAEERARLASAKVGLTLKGWRLTRLLGVGQVSAAYEASRGSRDGAAGSTLRLMIGNVALHDHARSHFLRAAYAANRFQHPRVIPVTGDGTDDDGAAFVVRPSTDAQPLAEVVKGDLAMGERQVLKIAEQVLDALEIAHAHGVVHGAISPTNVLVTPRGSIRLCDFSIPPGMAAGTSEEQDILAVHRASPWSAPERCGKEPAPASEACDVYGLGATMYFAIAKRAPRGEGASSEELARTPSRPLREVAPAVSEDFARVVDQALAADPARRYESAYAMLGDVRRVLAGRKPKLGAAMKPNPSGSYSGMGAQTSRSRLSNPTSRADAPSLLPSAVARSERARRNAEWKGNVALILAIALLVGVATFVMVREKVDEERDQEPTHAAERR